jgi:hypothetical protein
MILSVCCGIRIARSLRDPEPHTGIERGIDVGPFHFLGSGFVSLLTTWTIAVQQVEEQRLFLRFLRFFAALLDFCTDRPNGQARFAAAEQQATHLDKPA